MSGHDELSDWAEQLDALGPDAHVVSGDRAAARGQALLEGALGGAENVERALRGRQPLDGSRVRGYRSPTRSFRLTPELDAKLAAVVDVQQRHQSEILRDALSEYFERHAV